MAVHLTGQHFLLYWAIDCGSSVIIASCVRLGLLLSETLHVAGWLSDETVPHFHFRMYCYRLAVKTRLWQETVLALGWTGELRFVATQLPVYMSLSYLTLHGFLYLQLKEMVHPKMKLFWKCAHSQAFKNAVCFFIRTDLEKFSITWHARQWILCSEWVPSEIRSSNGW